MNKYICIHGHFYQPPRENPWLDEVEIQDSAAPFHDWNQRITSECYSRNAASRILDNEGNVLNIVSNYAKMNFNIGPTLLSWMESNDPEAYRLILESDKESMERFNGHGSAIAQAYNHIIMPLANSRDKRTQILWGIRDFEHRFGRFPEGMWLAETAVDTESLEIMAEAGIAYTILAPHQGKGMRKLDSEDKFKPIDPKIPYICKLPSGKTIILFFYDGPTSQSVAFEGLLQDGSRLANRLAGCFTDSKDPQLVHIATDGETYGHHHKFGDMALAYAFQHIEENNIAELINYGLFLEKFPPKHEAEIVEDSSWSCVHGIERWRSNCGCCSGMNGGWQQEWRGPMRDSLDYLRDAAIPIYEQGMREFVEDPWKLRDEYVDVILNRKYEHVCLFAQNKVGRELNEDELVRFLKLLEIQSNALLMYTSCGWFFDEVSGIETVQCMKYAARVIQLVQELTGENLESEYLKILKKAPSNVPEVSNGAHAYEIYAKPSVVDLMRVSVHYAITSLYNPYEDRVHIYSYTVDREEDKLFEAGRQRLLLGRATITSRITCEKESILFAVFHMGDHIFVSGACLDKKDDVWEKINKKMPRAFKDNDIQMIAQLVNEYFGEHSYSLWHLFKKEQKDILDEVLKTTMGDVEESFRDIYQKHYALIQIKNDNRLQLPKTFINIVEFVVRRELEDELANDMPNIPHMKELIGRLKAWSLQREQTQLIELGQDKINEMMAEFGRCANDVDYLRKVLMVTKTLFELELPYELWSAQNIYFKISQHEYLNKKSSVGKEEWVSLFEELGKYIKVRILTHV